MRFINYNIFPIELHQCSHANSDSFKSCETHIKLPGLQLVFNDILSEFLFSDKVHHFALWKPLFKFIHPISYNGFGHDNKMLTVYLLKLSQECYESYCLYCFA
jgi:hypothetical protein